MHSPQSATGARRARQKTAHAWQLAALPVRAALLGEGGDALVEVVAAVGLPNQVAGVGYPGEGEAAQGLLSDPHGDRGVRLKRRAQLAHPFIQFLAHHDLRREARCQRLLGREHPGGEDEGLRARRPDERHEPRVVLDGEAVSQSSGYGHPELRLRGADAQVAHGGDAQASPDGVAVDHGDGRLVYRFQPPDDALHPLLVGDAVLARLELQELLDVRAGHERLLPRPTQHEHTNIVVGVDRLAALIERVVHLPGHRVARLGPVEGDGGYRFPALKEKLVGLDHRTFLSRRSAIVSLEYPSSIRVSSVCSPSRGAGRRISPGVSLSLMGMPSDFTVPSTGCSISTIISRAWVCGSSKTSL